MDTRIKKTPDKVKQARASLRKNRGRHDEARAMRARGATLREIGHRFGVSNMTVMRWTDDQFRERTNARQNKQKREARLLARPDPTKKDKPVWTPIPPDTRDLTARTLGDPLPGRSALDRRAH